VAPAVRTKFQVIALLCARSMPGPGDQNGSQTVLADG